MSDDFEPRESELNALEAALGSLRPARNPIDRDRVMYRAGQASASATRNPRAWPAVAASLALVALGEGALLARRPPARIVERVVVVRDPTPAPAPPVPALAVRPPAPSADPSPWLGRTAHDRRAGQVFRYGLDGLPGPSTAAWGGATPGPAPSRRRLQDELDKALALGDLP